MSCSPAHQARRCSTFGCRLGLRGRDSGAMAARPSVGRSPTRCESPRPEGDGVGTSMTLTGLFDGPERTDYLIPVRVVWMAPEEGREAVGALDRRIPARGSQRSPRACGPGGSATFAGIGCGSSQPEAPIPPSSSADYEVSGQVDPVVQLTSPDGPGVSSIRPSASYGEIGTRSRGSSPRRSSPARSSSTRSTRSPSRPAPTIEAGRAKAERYLREIAATHSPYAIDLIANGIHKLYSQGYGGDPTTTRNRCARSPSWDRSTRSSSFPRTAPTSIGSRLQFMLWENDLPPNHTAGGINMNFFPIGPLMRRTGVFFIRRSFKDNRLYKTVLKGYLDYLIEKRFPLEWYMEGGRSRSGRLGAPRFGLLSYVVDSLTAGQDRRHRADPGLDRLRPDPGRPRLRPRGPGQGKAEGVVGVAASGPSSRCETLWRHPHPLRRAGFGCGQPRLRSIRGRRSFDRSPEARLRGHVSDRSGDSDHPDRPGDRCPSRGQGQCPQRRATRRRMLQPLRLRDDRRAADHRGPRPGRSGSGHGGPRLARRARERVEPRPPSDGGSSGSTRSKWSASPTTAM